MSANSFYPHQHIYLEGEGRTDATEHSNIPLQLLLTGDKNATLISTFLKQSKHSTSHKAFKELYIILLIFPHVKYWVNRQGAVWKNTKSFYYLAMLGFFRGRFIIKIFINQGFHGVHHLAYGISEIKQYIHHRPTVSICVASAIQHLKAAYNIRQIGSLSDFCRMPYVNL